jgi:group I intron endonuclease
MIIYKITNIVNNKLYIGQTVVSLYDRKHGHLADSKRERKQKPKTKISLAICKYGFDNFVFEKIDEANTQEELNTLEQKYILTFKSNNNEFGYNLLSGGNQGGKHSEETKKKISEVGKKNPTKFWLGKKQSVESNNKRREAIKGKSCPQRGNKYSEEDKIRISERMKKCRAENFWSTRKKTVTSI